MGQSAETTDFIVDCLTDWWHNNQSDYTELEELVINLDGGPAIRSDHTQLIKRIVELSQTIGLKIRLIYYPLFCTRSHWVMHGFRSILPVYLALYS